MNRLPNDIGEPIYGECPEALQSDDVSPSSSKGDTVKAIVRFLGRWLLATCVVAGLLSVGAGLALVGDVLNCRLLIGVCLILALTGWWAWFAK